MLQPGPLRAIAAASSSSLGRASELREDASVGIVGSVPESCGYSGLGGVWVFGTLF